MIDHPGYPGQCCDTSPCTCQPAQPVDLDAIEQRLRGALLDAIVADGLKPPAERVGLVAAMLAVVRPELDLLTAELQQAQQQAADARAGFLWRCTNCRGTNYPTRETCSDCREQRPADA